MTEPAAAGDEFQRELLELFAAEAYEWLAQIQQALVRFHTSLDPSERFDALDVIARGITSLGGSAATIDLPAIQEQVFGLLPVLDHLRAVDSVAAVDALANLRGALGNITLLVASSTGIPATVTFEAHKPGFRHAKELLHALHTLRRAQMRTTPVVRSVIDSVIRRVQQDLEGGVSQVDTSTILAQMDEVCRDHEEFVSRVQATLPALSTVITALKSISREPTVNHFPDQTREWLQGIDQLVDQARQREAVALLHFFQGLSSFIKIVTERRLTISAHRFGAVEIRLSGMASVAQSWLEAERAERAAIVQLLAA
ncbi:MAG: Hpt domain-containing protein [Nitrospiraceae bacterium]